MARYWLIIYGSRKHSCYTRRGLTDRLFFAKIDRAGRAEYIFLFCVNRLLLHQMSTGEYHYTDGLNGKRAAYTHVQEDSKFKPKVVIGDFFATGLFVGYNQGGNDSLGVACTRKSF